MVTPERLEFSSPSSPSLSRRRSLRLLATTLPAPNSVAETKKKKKKKKMIWNKEDELAVLKGLVEYREKTSAQLKFDWDGFYGFVRDSILAHVSKEQLFSKIKKLKRKFLADLEVMDEGNDSRDSEAFGLSKMIWGQSESDSANENGEETLKEDEEVPLNDNGTVRAPDCNGRSSHEPVVDKVMENGTAGEEIHDDATAADELLAVRDAFETMMSQGLTECQKRLKFEKLMNLGARKRQELSSEWKALCDEQAKLNAKKLRVSTKIAEAGSN